MQKKKEAVVVTQLHNRKIRSRSKEFILNESRATIVLDANGSIISFFDGDGVSIEFSLSWMDTFELAKTLDFLIDTSLVKPVFETG